MSNSRVAADLRRLKPIDECAEAFADRGWTMPAYRLVLFQASGEADRAIDLDRDTDAEAIEELGLYVGSSRGLELWQGTRLMVKSSSAWLGGLPGPPACELH